MIFGMQFSGFGKRLVLGAFDGGEITSDAGILLLREAAGRMNLFPRMAARFTDHRDRDRDRVTHQLPVSPSFLRYSNPVPCEPPGLDNDLQP